MEQHVHSHVIWGFRWHQFESLMDGGITTSITFWYKVSSVNNTTVTWCKKSKRWTWMLHIFFQAGETTKDISYPLKSTQKMAMKRNIEKMLFNALGSQEEVCTVLDIAAFLDRVPVKLVNCAETKRLGPGHTDVTNCVEIDGFIFLRHRFVSQSIHACCTSSQHLFTGCTNTNHTCLCAVKTWCSISQAHFIFSTAIVCFFSDVSIHAKHGSRAVHRRR